MIVLACILLEILLDMDRMIERKIMITLIAIELEKRHFCAAVILVAILYAPTSWYCEKFYL